jgi:aryl-alcohol dehydrogenase-like predicted oxidoreductase
MKRTILPGTALSVSRLSFGTASLHHLPTSGKRQRLLRAAVEHGFSHFDVSPYYGFGMAEREIGRLIRDARVEVTVASKVGLYPPTSSPSGMVTIWLRKGLAKLIPSLSAPLVDWSVRTAQESLENTLRTVGREPLDILFLHEPALGLIEVDEFLRWLSTQREAGKVRYWGLAGPLGRFASWVHHPIAKILQVLDADGGLATRRLLDAGRVPQITYGCLKSARRSDPSVPIAVAVESALRRNSRGSVLISTRSISHLRELARLAERNCRS